MAFFDSLKQAIGGDPAGAAPQQAASIPASSGMSSDTIYAGIKAAGSSILTVVVYGVFILAIGYIVYRFVVFNKTIHLKIVNKDGAVLDMKKRAGRIYKEKKTGVMKLKITGVKMLQEVPPEEYRQRQGRKDVYEGILDINGTVQWLKVGKITDEKYKLLEADPSDKKVWRSYEEQYLTERFSKPSIWDKYKDVIIPLAAFILAFLITFFFFKEVGNGMESMSSGMAAQAEAFKEMAQQCGSLMR